VAGVALVAIVAAVFLQPVISGVVGRWEVQRAYDDLRVPATWTLADPPVMHATERGGVLLSAVYRVQSSAQPGSELADTARAQGWRVVGGAPDLSTVILQRDELMLSAASLPERKVRLEVARYR
jgi:hypothetical protein